MLGKRNLRILQQDELLVHSNKESQSKKQTQIKTKPTLKEGFAFAHCTCKAPYHLRVHDAAMVTSSTGFVLFGVLIVSQAFTAYVDASLLVMIEEFATIWHSFVEKSVFVAVILGSSYFLRLYLYIESCDVKIRAGNG
ncbi:uncharacterized protein DS421_18g619510 [Arachis hypogaea]|nr:uncharacterized protein DS421_18g619510 [Arachis hypogaea]